jgi:hypothetical protein
MNFSFFVEIMCYYQILHLKFIRLIILLLVKLKKLFLFFLINLKFTHSLNLFQNNFQSKYFNDFNQTKSRCLWIKIILK